MIRSFATANREFSLIPIPIRRDPNLNIFSANSMTLLVGPNGSGKTQTLLSLAKAVSSSRTLESRTPDVEIDWNADGDRRSTFALYFTSIPYTFEFPSDTKHFAALHTRNTKGKVLPEVQTAMDLAKEFGLKANPTLALASFDKVFSVVKDLLFHPYISRRPAYKFDADWIEQLVQGEKKIFERREAISNERREKNISFEEMFESDEFKSIHAAENSLRTRLLALMEEKLDGDVFLRMRALHTVTQEQHLNRDVKIELLTQLGIAVVVDKDKGKGKAQPKAQERFNSALKRLRRICEVLKGADFRKSQYKLNLAQWAELSKLDLGGIAQLTVTGTSSGAAALLDQFARLKRAIETVSKDKSVRNLLLLIDEGDAFLHLEWQQQYINFLDLTVKKFWRERFDCIQIVMATHSPVLMSDFPRDCIHKFSTNASQPIDKISSREMVSFGAPMDAIVRSVGGAGTLGVFSARIMRNLIADIEKNLPIDQYRVDIIDDPVIKRHILRILEAKNIIFQANAN